ncbi:hypothetical protein GOP47_0007090 [Adiantum capillus-veneris]|uniref:Protein kinase domain-containing protein n=1 Tax=Adiantum capillus-veneris TaxID=13818 RepID=A0A9D4V005_ADICA|nr:hypothetical protein GOP47_0007090 [Adiantum capillus-veneris]
MGSMQDRKQGPSRVLIQRFLVVNAVVVVCLGLFSHDATCLKAMISALHLALLILLSGDALSANTHRIGSDKQRLATEAKELRVDGCQCMKSQNAEAEIDVTSISSRIGKLYENEICSCSHDFRLHQQVAVATYKSSFAYLSTHAHRRFHSLFARITEEPRKHRFDSKISRPFYNSRSKHDQSVASPPRGAHAMAPPFSAKAPAASPVPGPHPSHRRPHRGHSRISMEPSPSPSPGPAIVTSPAYSPTPDCSAVVCEPPLTKSSFVSQCSCVQPIAVELELSVPLYALFPIVSVLAGELAEGALVHPSQVEVVGANTSGQNPDFSIVDANFLPLQEDFDILNATVIAQKFWKHEVVLNRTLFGNYSVIYVNYPGLPPSPPARGPINGMAGIQKPFGVDVGERKKEKLGTHTMAVIVLSAVIAMAICVAAVWLILLKCRRVVTSPTSMPKLVSRKNILGGVRSLFSSRSFTSISFPSSAITCASTARLFTVAELERATNLFALENIIGEGGFGRVFCGILDDGSEVAVKVLTRDNFQGGKEFIAEVEMLSRLHHRNLVKLIGICTEEHIRCLVYELIPNGSVEFHLHDKSACPLDWEARLKIALGAARGLSYLHEDSSPRVIHRDFKAANILLDNDFNPKVADFGLAKIAPDGGKEHVSTRVMGTFGYVAPEYAMTGHLLVKSDVYSYGVVLLELLSGRKPVDMSQPPGQENLVTWARPLLTSMEGLQVLVDQTLKDSVSYDSLAKVAAIASMCVHPEVSDRPFMGEVVQALKLVCNDFALNDRIESGKCSQGDDCSLDNNDLQSGHYYLNKSAARDDASSMTINYDSGLSYEELQRPFSPSSFFSDSGILTHTHANTTGRHSLSGPLRHSHYMLASIGTGNGGSISEPTSLDVRLTIRQTSWNHETVHQSNFLRI